MDELERRDDYKTLVEPNLGYVGNMLRWGASVDKICDRLGCSVADFHAWAKSEKELNEVVRSALMQRDEDIQRAFFESALGGFHTEVTRTVKHTKAPDGSDGYSTIEEKQTTKWAKADPKMLTLMLKNTDPFFIEEDKFRRDMEREALDLRRRLLSANLWKPVDGKTVKAVPIRITHDGVVGRKNPH